MLVVLGVWGMVNAGLGQSSNAELDSLLQRWRSDALELEERLGALNKGYVHFHQEFPEVFLVELDTLLSLSRRTNQPSLAYEAHLRRGGLFNYRGQNEEALDAYDKAETVALSLGDSLRLGSVEKNRGIAHASRKEYVEALGHFSSAAICYRAVGDSARAHQVGMALGSVFALLGDHVLAKAHYQQIAMELSNGADHDRLRALLDLNLGWSQYKLAEFESAIELSLKALAKLRKYNSGFHIAGCLTNLAQIHLDRGDLELAMAYVDSGTTQCETIGAVEDLLACELMRADIERQMGKPEMALQLLDRIENEIQGRGDFELLEEFHDIRYAAFKALNNAEEALSEHEKRQLYHDSVQAQTNSFAIARAAYAKDKEHQIQMVEMNAQLQRDRQSLSQLRTVLGLVVGFGAVLAMLVMFILKMRAAQEEKRQRLLDEIQNLKSSERNVAIPTFESLNRDRIENSIGRPLNETDWNVLNLLLDAPTITNAKLAEKACLSVDGIGSSLRRMYGYFDIKETKYKKIALLHAAITISKEGEQIHPHA
jgi:tetratricopeptide (TPR) repeat protein